MTDLDRSAEARPAVVSRPDAGADSVEPDDDIVFLLVQADLRDADAERRDRAAEERDLEADARERSEGSCDPRPGQDRVQASIDRIHSGRDRDAAARHRSELFASRRLAADRDGSGDEQSADDSGH